MIVYIGIAWCEGGSGGLVASSASVGALQFCRDSDSMFSDGQVHWRELGVTNDDWFSDGHRGGSDGMD